MSLPFPRVTLMKPTLGDTVQPTQRFSKQPSKNDSLNTLSVISYASCHHPALLSGENQPVGQAWPFARPLRAPAEEAVDVVPLRHYRAEPR